MTATRRDLRDALEAVGRRPAPAPRPDFVAALEARLLQGADMHDLAPEAPPQDDAPELAPVVELHSRRRNRVTVLVGSAAAAVAAIVLAGSLAGWFGGGSDASKVELTDAVETTVELPDGSVVEGQEGLELPDGAIVTTGPDGAAAAGGVEIGPGEQATVQNGQLLPPVTVPALPPVPSLPPVEATVPTVPGVPGL